MKSLLVIKKIISASVIIGFIHTSNAQEIPSFLEGSVFHKVGTKEGVDPLLLYAVSLTESAKGKNRQEVQPSVYVIRTPNGAIYPKTIEEAKKHLKASINAYGYKALDVGLMQINGQHWSKLKNKYALFNPYFNVTFGARILKKAIASTDDKVIGIGRYHSFTEWRAKTYGNRVIAIYNNLKSIE